MKYKTWIILSSCMFSSFTAPHLHAEDTFFTADYVIVGVGTAGGLLARQLSNDNETSVIALHSGENLTNNPLIKYSKNAIFTVLATLLGNPTFTQFPPSVQKQLQKFMGAFSILPALYERGETIPQPNADDRNLLWVLSLPEGGASSINAGAWVRGTNQLYAQWAPLAGPHWSVTRILKTFKQLEHYHGKSTDSDIRGHNGPLSVQQVKYPSKFAKQFSRAVIKGTGFPFVLDYNDPNTPIGVSPQFQYTKRGHRGKYRVSSATAFLNKHIMTPEGFGVHDRKLRVLFNSFALRAIWEGNKAVGVEFIQNGVTKKVFANKGVIICAGLRSSTFLLQSGVGPQSLLQSLNIPVIFDNPNVGQGLADQPGIALLFTANPKDAPKTPNNLFEQISFLPAPGGDPTIRQVRFATANPIPGIGLAVLDLVQPKSRGSITINSSNPQDPPVIDFGFLSNPDDLTLYQAAFTTYIKAINAALQSIDPLYQLIYPDPAIIDDPLLLTSFIQNAITSNMSFQSHCRMAPLSQGGVVDGTGHVYGVEQLIVADDSVVPQCMDGATMASAYLIAANIARLLGF